ncbi:fimbrial protein [Providencia sp. R33]|uniref:fimbrial protein n=1 Tax=Providencia sp. R33 TaxID=2828763 RepID=UPI00210762B8|nr:fimbrial protein [Providencia sp. R33]
MILLFFGKAQALYLSSDISALEPNKSFFSKSYINDTKKVNLYTFSAYQIDKPDNNEKGKPIEEGEIIFTPLKKILLSGEQEYFKIFYRGKEDDKERYYKIVISETALDVDTDPALNQQSLFYPTVSLETYFVVRPKNIDFQYAMDANAGVLKNTGNTYFRVLVHENCEVSDDVQPLVLHLLPQQEFRNEVLKKKSRKYIVIFDKYHSIGNCD